METVDKNGNAVTELTMNNEEVRQVYYDELYKLGISQEMEAYEIGSDRKTPSNWLNPKMAQCNIHVGAVPLSHASNALLGWLASKCNCVFVPLTGEFNGVSVEEIRAIGEAYAKLYEETNPAKRKKLLQLIATNASAAIKEEGI